MWGESDFTSDSGMLTSVWGPALWHTLHTISFNYPTQPDRGTQQRYRRFMRGLRHVLPCRHCRENFRSNAKAAGYGDAVFASRDAFSRFVFRLHNHVNVMLGKPEHESYDKVRDQYENFRSRCLQNPEDESCHRHTLASEPSELTEQEAKEARHAKEKGCTEPLYGQKSKCLIRIVPKESPHRTFAMDSACRVRKKKR